MSKGVGEHCRLTGAAVMVAEIASAGTGPICFQCFLNLSVAYVWRNVFLHLSVVTVGRPERVPVRPNSKVILPYEPGYTGHWEIEKRRKKLASGWVSAMIPTTSANAAPPTISGKLLFHVIVDDFHRTFSIDGPGGPNGVRLHYEMLQAARAEKKKLRDFDLRMDSHEAALAEMQSHFSGYQFLGTWASSQSN